VHALQLYKINVNISDLVYI